MHIQLAALFFVFIFVWFTIRYFYRTTICPVVYDYARFRIFALRDELRRIELTVGADKNRASFRFMEDLLNQTTHVIERLTLIDVILSSPRTRQRATPPELESFLTNAPQELRALDGKFFKTIFAVMCLNSPLLSIVGFLWITILSLLELAGKNKDIVEYKQAVKTYAHTAPHFIHAYN